MTKVVSAGTNTIVIPLMIPGTLSGRMILVKCLDISGTEISGCGNNIFVNLYKYIVNRQHHERQEVVDHTEDDRCRCVDNVP